MSNETPSVNDGYCQKCTNYVGTLKNNAYEYLWIFVTYYPVEESRINYDNKECDLCMCVCTTLCCPMKSIFLIPVCPICIFCPSYCSKEEKN